MMRFNKECAQLRENYVSYSINYPNVGADGSRKIAKQLVSNHCLERLWLTGCHIGDEGLATIASVLTSQNSTLTFLDLADNGLTDKGMHSLALALIGNTTLQYVLLDDNPSITIKGVNFLRKALDYNWTIVALSKIGRQNKPFRSIQRNLNPCSSVQQVLKRRKRANFLGLQVEGPIDFTKVLDREPKESSYRSLLQTATIQWIDLPVLEISCGMSLAMSLTHVPSEDLAEHLWTDFADIEFARSELLRKHPAVVFVAFKEAGNSYDRWLSLIQLTNQADLLAFLKTLNTTPAPVEAIRLRWRKLESFRVFSRGICDPNSKTLNILEKGGADINRLIGSYLDIPDSQNGALLDKAVAKLPIGAREV